MSSWVDDLLGKVIKLAGVELPQRKNLNFIQSDGAVITITDNPSTQATDVMIGGTSGSSAVVDQAPTVSQSGTKYNNVGAAGQVIINLPANPPVGTVFYGRVADPQYLRFKANTGQTIQLDAILSASAGYVRSNYVGAAIAVEAVSSSRWFASLYQGPWTADS